MLWNIEGHSNVSNIRNIIPLNIIHICVIFGKLKDGVSVSEKRVIIKYLSIQLIEILDRL